MDDNQQNRLHWVLATALGAFVIELSAGQAAASQALQADALDFLVLGTSLGLALYAEQLPREFRAGVRLLAATVPMLLGVWIAFGTLWRCFAQVAPEPTIMAAIGFVGLAANGLVLYLLEPARKAAGTARDSWFAARNDMVGNAAVVIGAGVVALLATNAADLVIATVSLALLMTTGWQALWPAWLAFRAEKLLPKGDKEPNAP